MIGGEAWEDNAAMFKQLMEALSVVGFPEEVSYEEEEKEEEKGAVGVYHT